MTVCSPWVTADELTECGCSTAIPGVLDLAAEAASEVLYNLTAQQYPGTCTERLRPCANGGGLVGFNWSTWPYPWVALRVGGQWLNIGPCGCHMASECACSPYPRVDLGRSDVQSITEVSIDGEVLAAENYRLDSHRYLVRLDAGWPCCQNLGKNVDETGTWYIDLTYGWPIPADLTIAARSLASEYVKLCNADDTCRLPRQAISVVRDGVAIQFIDVAAALTSGLTGLWEVDQAIQAHNPNRLTVPSGAWSPDIGGRGLRSVVP